MSKGTFCAALALCLLFILSGTSLGQQVSVNVIVVDNAGTPIDGLVVSAYGANDDWSEDVTNDQGQVALTLTRPVAYQSIVVGLLVPSIERQGITTWRAWEERRVEVLRQYATEGIYDIPLEEGVDTYELSITLHDAVSISGRVISGGVPASSSVAMLGALWGDLSDRATGLFSIGGVRAGSSAALVFVRGYGQRELRWFDGTETLENINIGDVILTPTEGDSRLDLDVTEWEQLDLRGRLRAPCITLVRDDGELVVSLTVDAQGRATLIQAFPTELWIPAGTYYISPGPVGPDPVSTRLIQLVRDGVVDLDAAGVPKLTTIAGQVTTIQVDAPAAEAAIMNAGG